MTTSLYIAKLMGPVLIAVGAAIVLRAESFGALGREFIQSKALIFLSGLLTLPLGIALVLAHNVWVLAWPLIITVFGWVAIAAGVVRILLFDRLPPIGAAMLDRPGLIRLQGGLMLLLGFVLAYNGYFA